MSDKFNPTQDKGLNAYLNLFKAPNGAIYQVTGKTSSQDMTFQDFEKVIADGFKELPENIISMLNRDQPEITNAITPRNVTPAQLHHYMLARLARDGVPTNVFRPLTEAATPEARVPHTIDGRELLLTKSEIYAFRMHSATISIDGAPLDDFEKRIRASNQNLSDVALRTAGYAAGAVPQFNNLDDPSKPKLASVYLGEGVGLGIKPSDQEIQDWFCSKVDEPYISGVRPLNPKLKTQSDLEQYTVGFMQARKDARAQFKVDEKASVGIYEPCPPAQTPNTSVANGNGTSAAPKPGGGNANAAPKGR